MTQYDAIALDYQKMSAAVPLRDAEWYSLRVRLGDLTGLAVLDLACGDGMGTRLLKRWGADRVVGVDISTRRPVASRRSVRHRRGLRASRRPSAPPAASRDRGPSVRSRGD